MARIRTIKPEFFRHHHLYVAETEEKLPLRVAFAGLWTSADREGRFRWIPEELKLDCLPYDQVDFSRVLDALATRGFLVRYSVNGHAYGWIPGFPKHQIINNRERDSELPEPPVEATSSTREPHVVDACPTRLNPDQVEGKGKEGKGRESARVPARATPPPESFPIVDKLKEWASRNVPGLDLQVETEKFLDHHRSKGNRFTDWPAAWRKWMRNAAEWGHARVNGNGNGAGTAPAPSVCKTCNRIGVIVRDGDRIRPWSLERECQQGLKPEVCPDCRGKNRLNTPGLPDVEFG